MCQTLERDQQQVESSGFLTAGEVSVREPLSPEEHIQQYTQDIAKFFEHFNAHTRRPFLYQGYISGFLENRKNQIKKDSNEDVIAIDFGCGTGWLAQYLSQYDCFKRVYAIDTSIHMLRLAIDNVKQNITRGNRDQKKILFRTNIPDGINGTAHLAVAAHVHYHFATEERLSKNFFGAISSSLRPDGEFLLIGCPSDYLDDTPDHYNNSVPLKDVPLDVLQDASSPEALQDKDGYIKLEDLPRYALAEGQQMKATFYIQEGNKLIEKTIKDTFWSDKKLADIAERNGLELISQTNLPYEPCRHAYMIQRYRKVGAAASVATHS